MPNNAGGLTGISDYHQADGFLALSIRTLESCIHHLKFETTTEHDLSTLIFKWHFTAQLSWGSPIILTALINAVSLVNLVASLFQVI